MGDFQMLLAGEVFRGKYRNSYEKPQPFVPGKVEKIGEVTGPEVFHEVAKAAALQWEFTPAIQNDRPVKVWVAIPFNFSFRD